MERLERINKYLSTAGVCSRREVDGLIADFRVEVNGQPARIGQVIDTTRDRVTVDGQLVDPAHPAQNAIDAVAYEAAQERPWWVEREERRAEREEAERQNPKSKLLRKGKKNAQRHVTSVKKLSGKSPLPPREQREREERRQANRTAKTFGEALADKQKLMNVKVRRVEGVNPKAASARGKKSAPTRRRGR